MTLHVLRGVLYVLKGFGGRKDRPEAGVQEDVQASWQTVGWADRMRADRQPNGRADGWTGKRVAGLAGRRAGGREDRQVRGS